MRRAVLLALAALAVAGCAKPDRRAEITVQRFFGECGAVYGRSTDVSAAEGECGIITTIINRFKAENPDVNIDTNVIAWPGYAQLTAQIAAGDPPDLVTMHQGVISDYQRRGLLEPMDAILREAGVRPRDFTAAGRRGVTKDGRIYGLPWDTVGGLAHVNTGLFARAGLMRGGKPLMPRSPEELLEHARRFKAATGKPYLIQSQVNDPATHVRNLYTYLLAQDAVFFPDAQHIRLRTPETRRVVELFRTIEREGLTTRNQDNPAAIASFFNGEGGVFLTGTWMIGAFDQEARTPGRPLYGSYGVYPYPRLWGREAAFVDGHAWVMPRRKRTPEQRQALVRLIRFMAAHDYDWARTGHLPAFQAVVDSPRFKALPHRADIAPLARTGAGLPAYVQRQGAIEGMVGEELSSAVAGTKTTEQALADAERRVNDLLSRLS
ncbi:MAG TPA: extracellular solute-binding protein [Caulobacteraceae bacterium]|jgi:multiple sugar transport system substrate-binding protein